MSVTIEKIRSFLDPEEPNYAEAAKLGPAAIPLLLRLVKENDPLLSSKATYLASLIESNESVEVLKVAASSPNDVVRVAAAAGIKNLKEPPVSLAQSLLKDKDAGVRKVALRSIEIKPSLSLKPLVEEIAKNDPEKHVREIATKIIPLIK